MNAELIADWWVQQIDEPRKFNNGVSFQEMTITALAANTATKAPTGSQIQRFRQSLVKRLTTAKVNEIVVDYGPDAILQGALDDAGIIGNPFPVKTAVRVNSLTGKVGYDGVWEPLTVNGR